MRDSRSAPALVLLWLICSLLARCALCAAPPAPPATRSVPTPEKLLPDDTIAMFAAPDVRALKRLWQNSPQAQLWSDPAMKPFADKFVARAKEEFIEPLERELNLKFSDYTDFPSGQVSLAFARVGAGGDPTPQMAWVLLVDAVDKAAQLQTNLTALTRKWTEAGKSLRSETIQGIPFTVLLIASNDVPRTFRKFFPHRSRVQELGQQSEAAPQHEFVVGQASSLLIVGSSVKLVERIANRLQGGSAPTLCDLASYQANHVAMFRDAPVYAWFNVKAFLDMAFSESAARKENTAAPNPFDLQPSKVLEALGFSGVKSLAFCARSGSDGIGAEVFVSLPEASRQGLFKMLAGEPKETSAPPFVPADAVKFQRWRIDAQKTWATLQKMIADISPQMLNAINFILDSADTYARQKDPGFNIRQNLLGNLGDDLITYERAPKVTTEGSAASSPPSLVLIGSPNPEQMAAAFKNILVFLSQEVGAPPQEREFLGRKILSVALGAPALQLTARNRTGPPPTLHYAAASGYVAVSTDAAMVEEFLRTCESQPKPLRELPGLLEAAQKVTGPNCTLFGYQNQSESMRALFENLRNSRGTPNPSVTGAAALFPGFIGTATPQARIAGWMDFSLLPSYEKIARNFTFSVYSASTTTEGLCFKMFMPCPPGGQP